MMRLGLFAWLTLTALLAACVGPSPSGSVEPERLSAASTEIEDYRLGVGDKVRVTVYNEPSLSGEYAVTPNGTLSLPLIGDVAAVGKSPSAMTGEIEARLADGYLREPKVSMEVLSYRPYFILGEVKTPGQYPYVSGLTVMNAIAVAEGFTPRSERRVVFIRRSGSAEERSYALTPDLRILPGDTIRLGERFF